MHFNKEEALRTMDMIHNDARSIQVQKYSSTTLIQDCKDLADWLKAMGKDQNKLRGTLASANLQIWRCRIGRDPWFFGWTASDAILTAYDKMMVKKHDSNTKESKHNINSH